MIVEDTVTTTTHAPTVATTTRRDIGTTTHAPTVATTSIATTTRSTATTTTQGTYCPYKYFDLHEINPCDNVHCGGDNTHNEACVRAVQVYCAESKAIHNYVEEGCMMIVEDTITTTTHAPTVATTTRRDIGTTTHAPTVATTSIATTTRSTATTTTQGTYFPYKYFDLHEINPCDNVHCGGDN